jgi:hypothetical protein
MSISTFRKNVNDFIAAVGAQGVNAGSSQNLYVATLNADNATVNITKNGVVIFSKVFWPGNYGAARIDAGGSNSNSDTVNVFAPDGTVSTVSATSFLANLI